MDNHEQMVRRSLQDLAAYAPAFEGFPPTRPKASPHALLLTSVASACLVAGVIGATVAMSGDKVPAETPNRESDHLTNPSENSLPLLPDLAGTWPVVRSASCSEWALTGQKARRTSAQDQSQDSIVVLGALDDTCLVHAPRDATTVLLAPYRPDGLFGSPWAEVTAPWRSLGGHLVRRLTSGALMEMSSRAVDGVVCSTCAGGAGQIMLVVGPDPTKVSALVESVGGKFN